MPIHLDVLGRLHVILGGFAALAGASLIVLAAGTSVALVELGNLLAADGLGGSDAGGQAGVWILAWCGVIIVAAGGALALTGRALERRRPAGRIWALALAAPDLLIVPFGTALSIYAFWVLLNDEARREFGRPPRAAHRQPRAGGA